jgi:hypothetical protein
VFAINISGLLLFRQLLRSRQLAGWALAQGVGLTLYLPGLLSLFGSAQGGNTSWIPPASVRDLLFVLSDFAGGFMQPTWFTFVSVLLVGLGLILGLRSLLGEAHKRWLPYALLLPWLVLPVGISFSISQPYYRPELMEAIFGSRPSIFLTRNLITVLFPLLLLLARSLVLLQRQPAATWRLLGIGLAGALLALYSLGYLNNHLVPRKENYRAAAGLVSARAAPEDLVLTSPGYIEQPLAYYYYDKQPPAGLSLESVRDGVVESRLSRQDPAHLGVVEPDVSELILQHDRVWLVTNDNIYQTPDPALIVYLGQQADLEEEIYFEGTLVRLYVLPDGRASSE